MAKRIRRRLIITLTILTFSCTFGCATYRRIESITPDEAETLVDKRVKLYTDGGMHSLTVTRVEYPYVHGTSREDTFVFWEYDIPCPLCVDLREVTKIEVYDPRREAARLGLILGVVALLAIVDFYSDE